MRRLAGRPYVIAGAWFGLLALLVAGPLLGRGYLMLLDFVSGRGRPAEPSAEARGGPRRAHRRRLGGGGSSGFAAADVDADGARRVRTAAVPVPYELAPFPSKRT
jgi:hypothetical protein